MVLSLDRELMWAASVNSPLTEKDSTDCWLTCEQGQGAHKKFTFLSFLEHLEKMTLLDLPFHVAETGQSSLMS